MAEERSKPTKFKVLSVLVKDIEVSYEANVRHRQLTLDVYELAESIATIGLLNPLMVQKIGSKYQLISGQRRFQAIKLLEWKEVPCQIVEGFDLPYAKIVSLSENLHRRDLDPKDIAEACQFLLEKYKEVKKVASLLGYEVQTVEKYLDYGNVKSDLLRKAVTERDIYKDDATRIWTYTKDNAKHKELVNEISKMTRAEKNEVIDKLRDNPKEPIKNVLEKARVSLSKRKFQDITIHLTKSGSDALEEACILDGKEPEEIASGALYSYLKSRGLLKGGK